TMQNAHSRLLVRWLSVIVTSLLLAALLSPGCTRPRPRIAATGTPPLQLSPSRMGSPSPSPSVPTGTVGQEEVITSSALLIGDRPDVVPGQVVLKLQLQPALRALTAEPGADGIIATGVQNIDRLNRQFSVKNFEPLLKPLAEASGASVRSLAERQPALLGLYLVSYEADVTPETVAAAYASEPNVVFAEPNYYAYASDVPARPFAFIPNDPYFDRQWNLQAIQAPQAWDYAGGQGIVVAVVDSGVAYEDFEHYRRAPDLANTLFVAGYDFVNNDPHANDDFGHGTHVAGTIAQSTNNGRGVAGVAFGATLMPVKVLDARGQGGFDAVARGVIFAADQGARVINLSLSGRKPSRLLQEAVQYAVDKGALVVAAAGNSGGAVEYPAAYDPIIAVGAVDYRLQRARYSNFGSPLDLVAPGGDTRTDANGDGLPDGILQETFQGDPTRFALHNMEGTSMAAPHVSGVAALLFAFNPSATAAQVRQVLEATARDLGTPGFDENYGYGLVQAAAALAAMGAQAPTETPQPSSPTPSPTATAATPSPAPPTATHTATATRVMGTPSPAATATFTPTRPPVTPSPSPTDTSTPTRLIEAPSPSPTSSPTATVAVSTATPIVSGGEQLLINGGFETEGGWVFNQTPVPAAYATEIVRSGRRSARLGIVSGPDLYSYSSLYQTVTIPAEVRRALLRYWTYPISQDVYPNDLQLVLILENFRIVAIADQSLSNARQWLPGSVDLTRFAGRTITVYFGVYNGGGTGSATAMYLDDVELVIER
ncbi:MAG: S8 family serine peptidase, partial [Anaerolineae bacterium]|nr:S8 family serine peptidase [Anaerolineae bacterium]